jgi:isoleucyl-tRNA synthetase
MPKTPSRKNQPPKTHDFLGSGFDLPKLEEKVLDFWKTNHIFEKSLAVRKGKRTFVFYEGPPGANGRPGIHHVLPRVFKDIILRYKTMRGYSVPRKSGWDTHGLPVELAAEKELGLKSKKEIEEYGIAAFNKKCQELVWQYKADWEKLTDRMGFWLDLKDPYITYQSNYIETLWWIVKKIADKGLLTKGHKVVPWCTRCGTALSSHELAQGYKEVTDRSVFMKFKVVAGQKCGGFVADDRTYILSWTTTPWTLPGNVALAVGESIKYALVKHEGETLVVAKDLLQKLFPGLSPVAVVPGKALLGLSYEPLFDVPQLRSDKSYKVYPAGFVTTTDGTGVVHTAVMYGEDDYELGKAIGLPQYHTVTEEGKFKADVAAVAGMYAKSKETEAKIFEHLAANGTFLRTEDYRHEYPHCWRCSTPLLYYARTSWFVSMAKLRKELVKNNKTINWIPEHFKEGRFGEWLREAKDWNFSRERYWGTPFPVWECAKCDHWEAVGSVAELEKKFPEFKHGYWMMRHGQAETNAFGIIDSGQGQYHLTPKGQKEAARSAKGLKKELAKKKTKIDLIISSPILRTRETAAIVAHELGVEKVVFDDRLYEIKLGKLSGCHDHQHHEKFPTYASKYEGAPEDGETLRDLRARMWHFLEDIEKMREAKNILIISHDYPIWMLSEAANGWTEAEAIAAKEKAGDDFIHTGDWRKLSPRRVPRNAQGSIDLHRPFVDAPTWPCAKCKEGTMERVKGVIDVWYDSGAMPFAQWHYPFEHKDLIDKRKMMPADYICEAVDQTRGWFYTLLAVSTVMGYPAPFKNVVCLGHINDKHGQKMSKSKGNVVDPWAVAEKYGMDAVRWYFFTATPPGEPKNFDEQEMVKSFRRFHSILYNSYVFYRTYADQKAVKLGAKNVLDQWILGRLAETSAKVTAELDLYHIREAGLALEELADDLSRWYIRRSRRRLQKPDDQKDFADCSATLGHVLREMTKLVAPFTPFFAEGLFGSLNPSSKSPSVHLTDWPKVQKAKKSDLGKLMAEVRALASAGLAERAKHAIKVRQPLAELRTKNTKSGLKKRKDLLEILKDEVNVKEIVFNSKLGMEIELDTAITPALRAEGTLRELGRAVQELRQKANLHPKDRIALMLVLADDLADTVRQNEEYVKREVGAAAVEYRRSDKFTTEAELKIDDRDAWIGLRKI